MLNGDSKGVLLVYTREPVEEGYTLSLCNSMHMAYSDDGIEFKPFNQNYGLLYPSATISLQNTINAKGLVNPYIFHGKDNTYGVVAVRVDENGNEDKESKGCILLWISTDLKQFKECGLINLNIDAYVQEAICEYMENEDAYKIHWQDTKGSYYKSIVTDLDNPNAISSIQTEKSFDDYKLQTNLMGIISGNAIRVEKEFAKDLLGYWLPLQNISVIVPESIIADSKEEVESVRATAVYSDGSTHLKKVEWDTSNVDFTKAGSYNVYGRVKQQRYEFPLAAGYADPVVFKWGDKYYFIATNDNTDAIGLFVREVDTVKGLFEKGIQEHIILDFDKDRQLIKTFWAPEFHVIGDDLYILFTVGGETGGPQSHMMKLKKGGQIINPADWDDPIRVKKMDGTYLAEEGITLDMTYMNVEGTSYLVWSFRIGFGTPYDTGSMLYIATIDPQTPWILTSEPVLLSRPLTGWENIDGTINNEGPFTLLTKDNVHLAFSGGSAGGYSYVVGFLSISRSGNLMNPAEWEKTQSPALSYYSVKGEYGPGHNSFFIDEDDNVMIAYHAKEILGDATRCTGIRRIHFNKDNFPVLNMSAERDLKEEFVNVVIKVDVVI